MQECNCNCKPCPLSLPLPPQINTQAYILWEQAGKPQGADYGDAARRALEERLRAGEACRLLRLLGPLRLGWLKEGVGSCRATHAGGSWLLRHAMQWCLAVLSLAAQAPSPAALRLEQLHGRALLGLAISAQLTQGLTLCLCLRTMVPTGATIEDIQRQLQAPPAAAPAAPAAPAPAAQPPPPPPPKCAF